MKAFEVFLEGRGGKSLNDCKESDAAAYILELNNESKSKATINRKISSLRAFYDYKIDEGERESNPFQKIKSAKNDKRQIEFLTVEEVNRMLSLPDDSAKGIRGIGKTVKTGSAVCFAKIHGSYAYPATSR